MPPALLGGDPSLIYTEITGSRVGLLRGLVMTRLFISYRRADSQTITGRIYDRLLQAFGGPQAVFKDVDSIPIGVDFKAYLDQQIARSDAVLVIIGPKWLTIADESGRRRLDSPDDFVRLEIEFALRRGMLVVPVLVGNAPMPAESSLPKSLRALAYRNAAVVRDDPDFHHDMDRLIGSLQQWTATGQMQLPRPAILAPPRRSRRWSIRGTLRLLATALVLATILLLAGVVIAVNQAGKEKGTQSSSQNESPPSALHIVNMTANPPSGQAPVTVEFGAAVDPPGEYAMLWEFGDGAVSEERNPVHTYTRPGHYSVHLTVHHPDGESDSRLIDIQVKVFCGPGEHVGLRLRAPDGVLSPDRVRAGIEDFMRNCPNVEIAPEYRPANMYGAALMTSMASGDIPDVFMFEIGMVSDLVDQGLLFDLRRFLSEEQAAQYASSQGRVFGIPYGPELWQLGVSSRSRNPEAAAALVVFLSSGTW
jgi:hypothetical protein